MANIIFDFDDTIFDTQKLKNDIFKKFTLYKIDIKTIEKTYKKAFDKNRNYVFRNHIKILQKIHNLEISDEIQNWFYNLNFESYLFPKTKKMLKSISKKHNLILITKGNPEFQNKKIEKSKIEKFFKEIYVIEEKKEKILKEKKWNYPLFFINDKKNENLKIKEKFPKIIIIQNKKGGLKIETLRKHLK